MAATRPLASHFRLSRKGVIPSTSASLRTSMVCCFDCAALKTQHSRRRCRMLRMTADRAADLSLRRLTLSCVLPDGMHRCRLAPSCWTTPTAAGMASAIDANDVHALMECPTRR